MKQLKLRALLLLGVVSLAGCAGSGNSDDYYSDSDYYGGSSSSESDPGVLTKDFSNGNNFAFSYYTSGPNSTQVTVASRVPTNSVNDINALNVDGQTITLDREGGDRIGSEQRADSSVTDYINDNEGTEKLTYRDLSYAVYGIYGQGNDAFPFAQGAITPSSQVPTTGFATYNGNAAVSGDNLNASSSFNVDFANQSVSGRISNLYNQSDVLLGANIDGNLFSGTRNGTYTVGRFFGPNAQELGGTFINQDDKTYGAFGARKN